MSKRVFKTEEERKAAKKAYDKAYREAHKEEHNASNKTWREKNKDYYKAYRETHKEEEKAYYKAWYEEHREERIAYSKARQKDYYENNSFRKEINRINSRDRQRMNSWSERTGFDITPYELHHIVYHADNNYKDWPKDCLLLTPEEHETWHMEHPDWVATIV